MIPPLPEGYDVPVAPLWPSILPGIGMIVAGVALLWWKLHQIGMKFREFRALMKNPPPWSPERARQLGVSGLIVLEGTEWVAPIEPHPDTYRDDTGTREAEA